MPPDLPAFVPPRVPPAAKPLAGLRLFRMLLRNPVAAIPEAAYRTEAVEVRRGGSQILWIGAPELVETVFLRDWANFPKSRIDDRVFRPIFGDSLLTASGEAWRAQRRLAAPAFRPAALAAYLPLLQAPFRQLAVDWAAKPGQYSVNRAMTAAALEAVCGALFSGSDALDGRRLSSAIDAYLSGTTWVIALATLGLPEATPHPARRRMRRAAEEARGIVGRFLQRRRDGPARDDLASALIAARDPETGAALSDESLVDLLLTLLAAGHETTANALTWALYCLAAQPERQSALAESLPVTAAEGRIEQGDLSRLEPVEAFLKETMRLFPPAPMMGRRAVRETRLGGVSVRPGALIFVPVYTIHRHHIEWQQPHDFDPDRFGGPGEASRHRLAFLPFGAGPRICIGSGLAMLEMTAALALMLAKLKFSLATTAPPRPVQTITLRPAGDLPLRVAPR